MIPETVTEGIYDYAENVESGSTLSTPTSSHTGEAPFASEGLGDTVIHLDKVGLFLLYGVFSRKLQERKDCLEPFYPVILVWFSRLPIISNIEHRTAMILYVCCLV